MPRASRRRLIRWFISSDLSITHKHTGKQGRIASRRWTHTEKRY
jgi:hypothetical protein